MTVTLKDEAKKAYGIISPAAAPAEVAGGKRGEAWLTLAICVTWLGAMAWGCVSALTWALSAPGGIFTALAWVGVAVTAVMALLLVVVIAIVIVGGRLRERGSD